MSYMLSGLPSYTALGMASLLPNETIYHDASYKVMVDDMPTGNNGTKTSHFTKNIKPILFAWRLMKH